MSRFTTADAEAAGHILQVLDLDSGRADATSHRYLPQCETPDGERCWTFAITHSGEDIRRSYLEHAAEAVGVCWACSQPEADWPNREQCRRCWVMYHAKVHRLWPRDCPPFPGDPEDPLRSPDQGGRTDE